MSPLENITSPEDKKTEVPKTSLLSILKNLFKKERADAVEKLDTLKKDFVAENNPEDPSSIPSQENDEEMASKLNDQIQDESLTKQWYTPPSDMEDKDIIPYTQEEMEQYGLAKK